MIIAGGHEQTGGENKAERGVRCLQVTLPQSSSLLICIVIIIAFIIITLVTIIIIVFIIVTRPHHYNSFSKHIVGQVITALGHTSSS